MKHNNTLITAVLVLTVFASSPGSLFSGDYAAMILGEWRNYDTESTILLYEKYVFLDTGEVVHSMVYVDNQELNRDTYAYSIKDNILILGMKKIIGSGNEYFRYAILNITDTELTIKRLSRFNVTEEETWVRTSRT